MMQIQPGEHFTEQLFFVPFEIAAAPILFAVVRGKGEKELFWRWCRWKTALGEPVRARSHATKLAELLANQMYNAFAALAYNLLVALKLLHLPDERQQCRLKTLIREVMILPGRFVPHARKSWHGFTSRPNGWHGGAWRTSR